MHSVVPPVPAADPRTGRYEVLDASAGQTYTFNRYGQHVYTSDLVTGRVTYNFTYSVNSYYGRLMKVRADLFLSTSRLSYRPVRKRGGGGYEDPPNSHKYSKKVHTVCINCT